MAAFNGASGERKTQDRVKNKFDIKIRSTHHLIELIKQGKLPDKIMLNVHPQRWNDELVPWVRELVLQNVKVVVKRNIVRRRERQRAEIGSQRSECEKTKVKGQRRKDLGIGNGCLRQG